MNDIHVSGRKIGGTGAASIDDADVMVGSRKMTARLQEATSSGRPVLLRMKATGHLAGSLGQSVDETTDWHAFLFDQLGLGYHPVTPG